MIAGLRARIKRLWPLPKPVTRPEPATNVVLPRVWARRRRWQIALVSALFLVLGGMALGELLGWPFLAGPAERALSTTLNRRVSLSAPAGAGAGAAATAFRIRFFGSVRVRAPWLEIAAPPWSATPYMLQAGDVILSLRYGDLWRAYRGGPLRIDSLQATSLSGTLERLADGRASWQFRPAPPPGAVAPPMAMPTFGRLQIARGALHLHDALLDIDVEARASVREGERRDVPALLTPALTGVASGAASATDSAATSGHSTDTAPSFTAQASGRYRKLPLTLKLESAGLLPWLVNDVSAAPKALTLVATVGRASLSFRGQALDAMSLSGISGHFKLTGPSLAAVGDPVGVTLPTTGAFRAEGEVAKQGQLWQVKIASATVGSSLLHGQFIYDQGRAVPLLSGQLLGARLMLADLGPVVGTTPATPEAHTQPAAPASLRSAPNLADRAPAGSSRPAPANRGRVLPDRPFDLPSMRAMDADVRIDIAEVDLNTRFLEPLHPLRAHLQMAGGVLRLTEIEARTGQGSLVGDVTLDGQGTQALWRADLRWDGVQLERWVRQVRADGAPPYVSGTLSGRASVAGQGRSTADILASLKGDVRTELRGGRVSHLAVEAAGLDIAQSLGVLSKGDDALAVQCAVADLRAERGVMRPRVMVLDTQDSSLSVDGSLSLASEAIDLRLVVIPKDFSPLTLRAPIRVGGSFDAPSVSIDKAPLARKLGVALLLALVNPLAALLPLIDPGDTAEAARGAAGCYGLKARLSATPKAPAAPTR